VIQESATDPLTVLAKRNPSLRSLMIQSTPFYDLAMLEFNTLGLSVGLSSEALDSAVRAHHPSQPVDKLRAYYGLPSKVKARVLTALLITAGDINEASPVVFKNCLKAVHGPYMSLVGSSQAGHPGTRAMILPCIEMLCGVVHAASCISEPQQVPLFISPLLSPLSSLMEHYAKDLSICEVLLRLFHDYAESCMDKLDPEQTITLLEASSNLLKTYWGHHCTSRVMKSKSGKEAEEEEEAYSDILCALQLLVNLSRGPVNEYSSNMTDVIFFGLQQMLPLMTQGLLNYPALCMNYFSLMGYMMESYPERISILPYNFLDVLLQSLLFGASHHDSDVAIQCLEGMEGLVKAHLKLAVFHNHLEQHPNLLDRCTGQIFRGVVFQQLISDRLDATLNALLVLVSADVSWFASVAT
jgi:hypothetical protein